MFNNYIGIIINTFYLVFSFIIDYFKDGLPPGASYNPHDVGLDESVLAQIQLHDSGIGGYRFPTMLPASALSSLSGKPYRTGRPLGLPYPGSSSNVGSSPASSNNNKSPLRTSAYSPASIPQPMNSIAVPFVLAGPRPFGRRPVGYAKGFRSQYGFRAAASELKPQFAVHPKSIKAPFKFLGVQPVPLSSSPISLGGASSGSSLTFDDSAGSLGNIFGIRSIKGIKSLVSYLTGGVSG